MTKATTLISALHFEKIKGVGACKAYSGMSAAIEVDGMQIILMAQDRATVARIAKMLNHKLQTLDPEAIYPSTIVHDAFVKRDSL